MKQKAEHHLEFLADRVERGAAAPLLPPELLRARGISLSNGSRQVTPSRDTSLAGGAGADEDAAGESDDGEGADDPSEFFQHEAGAGPQNDTAARPGANDASQGDVGTPVGGAGTSGGGVRAGSEARGASVPRGRRETSIATTSGEQSRANGLARSVSGVE